ncbi:hypothetical protein BH10ACI2_BH10ACI2_09530 [soil metagenome]
MKTTTRTIELTVEKRERKFVSRETTSISLRCGICGGTGPGEIFRLVINSNPDFQERADRQFLACLTCIAAMS